MNHDSLDILLQQLASPLTTFPQRAVQVLQGLLDLARMNL
jgi:hypothetical protein